VEHLEAHDRYLRDQHTRRVLRHYLLPRLKTKGQATVMSLKQIGTLLSGLAILSAASPLINARAAAPTVTLADGLVVGTATGVYNQPAVTGLVDAYLGIPYASPPNRFEAPVAATALKTPFLAQKYGAACIQQVNASGISFFLGLFPPRSWLIND
jgi:hypothetical protein